jgi:tRNA(Ile)-lysidine synthase
MRDEDEIVGGTEPETAIREFYRRSPPSRLGVAVSGGSDSLALLYLLHEAKIASLSVATVDHGLRPEAAGEALHVARICEVLGLPHVVLEWEGWDGHGNLQAEARRTRYAVIAEWAAGQGLDAVALGHTRDDQAETFLMRLAREAGVGGLAAMKDRFQRDGMEFHRPLLGVSRATLRDWLAVRGARWVEDASNDDESFERVRVRKALEALSPLGVTSDALSTVAEQLRQAEEALSMAASDWARYQINEHHGDLVIDRAGLLALPRETGRRILSDAILWLSGAEYPPRRDSISGLWPAIRGGINATLGGCLLLNSPTECRITREHAAVDGLATPTHALWDGRWRLIGPDAKGLTVRPLGEAVSRCPDWRETGMPRQSLLASPAVWRGDDLIAAPVAGLAGGWTAEAVGRDTFARFLLSR